MYKRQVHEVRAFRERKKRSLWFRGLVENCVVYGDRGYRGCEGASLVSADGLPLASVLKPGMEEDRIAARSAAILSLGERVSEELAKGSLEQITIKGA